MPWTRVVTRPEATFEQSVCDRIPVVLRKQAQPCRNIARASSTSERPPGPGKLSRGGWRPPKKDVRRFQADAACLRDAGRTAQGTSRRPPAPARFSDRHRPLRHRIPEQPDRPARENAEKGSTRKLTDSSAIGSSSRSQSASTTRVKALYLIIAGKRRYGRPNRPNGRTGAVLEANAATRRGWSARSWRIVKAVRPAPLRYRDA